MAEFLSGFVACIAFLFSVFVFSKIRKRIPKKTRSVSDTKRAKSMRKRIIVLKRRGYHDSEIAKTVGVSKFYVLDVVGDMNGS